MQVLLCEREVLPDGAVMKCVESGEEGGETELMMVVVGGGKVMFGGSERLILHGGVFFLHIGVLLQIVYEVIIIIVPFINLH